MGIFMVVLCFATVIIPIGWKFAWVHWFQFTIYFPKWNKLNNKYKITRLISIFFSIFCLALYFGYRWPSALQNIINYNLFNQSPSDFRSANISGLLLLDICSLSSVLIPLLTIFDKKKILLKPLLPIGLLGGLLALIWTAPEVYIDWSFNDFFLGSDNFGSRQDEPLTFLMHYWLIAFSILIMVWNGNFKWRDVIICFIFIGCYIAYVVPTSRVLDVYSHCTGLVYGDFYLLPDDYYIFSYSNVTINSVKHSTYVQFTIIFPLKHEWEAYIFAWGCFIWFALSIILVRNIFGWFKKKEVILISNLN